VDAAWSGQEGWQRMLGETRDAVRQALVTRQLVAHLPGPADGVEVLDVGCGQGTQLIELARRGYRVTGVDPSADLLGVARRAVAAEHPAVRERVTLVGGDLHRLDAAVDHPFAVVCCHGVLMYQPSLDTCAEELTAVCAPGGLLSVLTRNRFGIAMRAGMRGDWAGALAGFDARLYDNRAGVVGSRGDEPGEVIAAFAAQDVDLVRWYGVRLFTDHYGDEPPPADLDTLVEAELQAGARDPYRQLTSLTHFIGRRRAMEPGGPGADADPSGRLPS
jgi:S-adenosylmethionine-dependent methyltransferase